MSEEASCFGEIETPPKIVNVFKNSRIKMIKPKLLSLGDEILHQMLEYIIQ